MLRIVPEHGANVPTGGKSDYPDGVTVQVCNIPVQQGLCVAIIIVDGRRFGEVLLNADEAVAVGETLIRMAKSLPQ